METAASRPVIDIRTERMLNAPVVPLLIRLALPNVAIMVAQASTGLIETWWVSKLGTDALAGMALVFPAVMLMTTLSAGALGGSISSAVARALGAGRQEDANALVLHAVLVNVVVGLAFSAVFLLLGRPIYRLLGGIGGELQAALIYSTVVFAGNVFTSTMNGLTSVIRGTGNMLYPALVTCAGILFLITVSPVLIFGYGPIPGFQTRSTRVAAGPHRLSDRRCRDAPALVDRVDAQPGPHDRGEFPGKASADRLARGRALVLGLPRRCGLRKQRGQLAVGCRHRC
jgi:multisubunit Na+/H+ antiporter MnhC subunit